MSKKEPKVRARGKKQFALEIIPIYKKFFAFLRLLKKGEPAWSTYWKKYYFPYHRLWNAYFALFPLLDRKALRCRVEAIRAEHYSRLRPLLKAESPERILRSTHRRCLELAPPPFPGPIRAYLLVGFFSPEAFLLPQGNSVVIAFGLERFRDFSLLDVLYAHEYAHLLLRMAMGEVPHEARGRWHLLAEGAASWFSSRAFPRRPLTDHLFWRRDRLNWCLEHEDFLREIFTASSLSPDELIRLEIQGNGEMRLPPRTGRFLGFRAIEKYFDTHPTQPLVSLFHSPQKILDLDL